MGTPSTRDGTQQTGKQHQRSTGVDVSSVYCTMDEIHEVSLRVHHSVVGEVFEVLETVRADTGCTEVTLAEGPELGGFLRFLIRATTTESSLRAEVELQRTQVDELVRGVQAAGDQPWEDSVVAVYPLRHAVSMAEDGMALMRPDPDRQVVIQYPRRLDPLAMGNDRAEVLQSIATLANFRGMEATELADIVAVTARVVTDDRGNTNSLVSRAINEIVNLCHGARGQNQYACEARRRILGVEARVQDGPGGVVGPPLRVLFNAAGHVYLDEEGVRLADEIDSLGRDLDIGDDGDEEGVQLAEEIDRLGGDLDSGDDGRDRGGWGRE